MSKVIRRDKYLREEYDNVSEYLNRMTYSTGEFSKINTVDEVVDNWYQTDLFDEFGTTDLIDD